MLLNKDLLTDVVTHKAAHSKHPDEPIPDQLFDDETHCKANRGFDVANYNAIAAISETIINRLRVNTQPEGIDDLEYRTFISSDFCNSPITNGISLFVYRVFPNSASRMIPAGHLNFDGRKQQRLLPVDVHFFLTIWGGEASIQHTLIGWVMRVMEDIASLSANTVNVVAPGTFRLDETVELGLAEFRTKDLLRISQVLMPNGYQFSIPYYARVILLESLIQPAEEGGGTDEG